MSYKFDLNAVQSALGYHFRNVELIKTAFTHESALANVGECNVRLVFLGQRLLDLMITDHLCRDGVQDDTKVLNRRLEICRSALSYEKYISDKGLTSSIILSAHAEALRNSPPIHGQIFLALLAAIYRDGGMPSLKSFILPMIRVADGSAKYAPKSAASVSESEPLPKTKLAKTEEKPKKGLISAMKLFSKSKKVTKKEEPKPAPAPKPEKPEKKEPERKTFIRDALKPVSLPESMKTKPKKKNVQEKKPEPKTVTEEKTVTADDNSNYKSMLQELIQKTTHSASVLLKYTTKSPSKGKIVTEITLDGNKLSDGEAPNKKSSEREAAKAAYLALTNKKTKLYKWFSSLNGGEPISSAPVKEDYVSKLNRHYQKINHASSAPLTYEKRPSEKKSCFNVAILSNGEEIALGSGKSLKEAKQVAAEAACAKLGI